MRTIDRVKKKFIEFLLQRGAEKEIKNDDGQTAAIWAARCGHGEALKLLLQGGADKDTKDYDGWTGLMYAAYWGHPETIQILCENGANLNLTSKRGKTALDIANDKVRQMLISFGGKKSEEL